MDSKRLAYINTIKQVAIASCTGKGLFASLMIAQACLESNNGASFLSVAYHNHFGIKSVPAWKGATINMPTDEVIHGTNQKVYAVFRAYPTLEAGFADRNHFLEVNTCYAQNGVFKASTPEQQAQALVRAGYATDPAYATKLIEIITEYRLKQYDK